MSQSRASLFPAPALAVPAVLLLAAHALRFGDPGLAAALVLFLVPVLSRRGFSRVALAGVLAWGCATWAQAGAGFVALRLAQGLPWLRLALIMTAVLGLTALAAGLLLSPGAKAFFRRTTGQDTAQGVLFLLTAALLAVARARTPFPVLLADRFLPGSGWLEILGLALYAAWLGGRLLASRDTARARLALWSLFSMVFFAQLVLGLLGAERLLMTGALHLPVPALIVAGPLFRGHGLFMAVLYGATVLVVGPAWCSWLCYVGAWDGLAAARSGKRPDQERWRRWTVTGRAATLALTAGGALALRSLGASWVLAVWLAAGFGLAGAGIMLILSRRAGVMVHCATFCPIGLVGNVLGRINPFRVRMDDSCTGCGACAARCRYAALTARDIARGRPGPSCTLCGDCLGACAHGSIGYRFPGLSSAAARTAFLVLAVGLHAAFLGLARI